MKKLKLEAAGTDPIHLDIEHAQRLLDFEKSRGLKLWSVTDPNYTIVDGKIKLKSGTSGGGHS